MQSLRLCKRIFPVDNFNLFIRMLFEFSRSMTISFQRVSFKSENELLELRLHLRVMIVVIQYYRWSQ